MAASPRSNLSSSLLDRLWAQCHWTYEVWIIRRELFDANKRKKALERGPHMLFMGALNDILTEFVMLQIGKLHDGAVVAGRVTFSLEYVVEYGGWHPRAKRRLARLKNSLDRLGSIIRAPRNKLIAHHDLAAVTSKESLGAFRAGADKQYFRTLERFVLAAFEEATGTPCARFAKSAGLDARAVVNSLAKDTHSDMP